MCLDIISLYKNTGYLRLAYIIQMACINRKSNSAGQYKMELTHWSVPYDSIWHHGIGQHWFELTVQHQDIIMIICRASENIFRLQCKRGSSKWASPHHKQFATFLHNFYIFKQLLGNFEIWASVRRTLFSDALIIWIIRKFISSAKRLPFCWGFNATFDENPNENERTRVILGCAISSIACAKHRCTGGWLILWCYWHCT